MRILSVKIVILTVETFDKTEAKLSNKLVLSKTFANTVGRNSQIGNIFKLSKHNTRPGVGKREHAATG